MRCNAYPYGLALLLASCGTSEATRLVTDASTLPRDSDVALVDGGDVALLPDVEWDAAQPESGGRDALPEVSDLDATRADAGTLPTTPGDHIISFDHGGTPRSYLLVIPASYAPTKATPVVLVFHGNNQSAEKAATDYGLREEIRKRGMIGVFGEGVVRPGDTGGSWNAFACCSYARSSHVDDIGYVRSVLAQLEAGLSIDAKKVYATGFSNGAMFTHRLGVELGDRMAAIAPVAGCLSGIYSGGTERVPVPPAVRPLPVFSLHGRKDGTVPYEGGRGDNVTFDSELTSMTYWATQNGCADTPTHTSPMDGVDRYSYTRCTGGAAVEHGATRDGTHRYTLLEAYGTSTASVVLDFLVRYSLP